MWEPCPKLLRHRQTARVALHDVQSCLTDSLQENRAVLSCVHFSYQKSQNYHAFCSGPAQNKPTCPRQKFRLRNIWDRIISWIQRLHPTANSTTRNGTQAHQNQHIKQKKPLPQYLYSSGLLFVISGFPTIYLDRKNQTIYFLIISLPTRQAIQRNSDIHKSMQQYFLFPPFRGCRNIFSAAESAISMVKWSLRFYRREQEAAGFGIDETTGRSSWTCFAYLPWLPPADYQEGEGRAEKQYWPSTGLLPTRFPHHGCSQTSYHAEENEMMRYIKRLDPGGMFIYCDVSNFPQISTQWSSIPSLWKYSHALSRPGIYKIASSGRHGRSGGRICCCWCDLIWGRGVITRICRLWLLAWTSKIAEMPVCVIFSYPWHQLGTSQQMTDSESF